MLRVLTLVLVIIGFNYVEAKEKLVICYYGTWATYRSGLGKFDVENINVDLCTHIVYTFAGINSNGEVVSLDSYLDLADDWGRDNFAKFNSLKRNNTRLKTLLAVGGWNEGSAKYSTMAANATSRNNFVTSARDTIKKYNFDGLDLDWEYPNRRDTVHGQADVNNLSQLLKELREEFDKYGLLLTAAVASVKASASLSYDIPTIVQYLDFVNVMMYDMYGPWDYKTGHNAPLHKGETDGNTPKEDLFTVDVALQYWLNSGCPPEKLILGIPLYGHTFILANENSNSVGATSNGAGMAGPYTVTSGSIGYNEFCYKLQTESWDVRYDILAEVPYAILESNWVSYDDADSITKKIEYGLQYDIAGVMVWSIETDDFHGICHSQDFPLLRAINTALGKTIDSSTTLSTAIPITTIMSNVETTNPTTPSTSETTATLSSTSVSIQTTDSIITTITTIEPTAQSSSSSSLTTTQTDNPTTTSTPSVCHQVGLAKNPDDCTTFYLCVEDSSGFIPILFTCPGDLHWDQENLQCNYQELANCNEQQNNIIN